MPFWLKRSCDDDKTCEDLRLAQWNVHDEHCEAVMSETRGREPETRGCANVRGGRPGDCENHGWERNKDAVKEAKDWPTTRPAHIPTMGCDEFTFDPWQHSQNTKEATEGDEAPQGDKETDREAVLNEQHDDKDLCAKACMSAPEMGVGVGNDDGTVALSRDNVTGSKNTPSPTESQHVLARLSRWVTSSFTGAKASNMDNAPPPTLVFKVTENAQSTNGPLVSSVDDDDEPPPPLEWAPETVPGPPSKALPATVPGPPPPPPSQAIHPPPSQPPATAHAPPDTQSGEPWDDWYKNNQHKQSVDEKAGWGYAEAAPKPEVGLNQDRSPMAPSPDGYAPSPDGYIEWFNWDADKDDSQPHVHWEWFDERPQRWLPLDPEQTQKLKWWDQMHKIKAFPTQRTYLKPWHFDMSLLQMSHEDAKGKNNEWSYWIREVKLTVVWDDPAKADDINLYDDQGNGIWDKKVLQWQYMTAKWQDMSKTMNDQCMDATFDALPEDDQWFTHDWKRKGRKERTWYNVDFIQLTQTNYDSKTVRQIRLVAITSNRMGGPQGIPTCQGTDDSQPKTQPQTCQGTQPQTDPQPKTGSFQ